MLRSVNFLVLGLLGTSLAVTSTGCTPLRHQTSPDIITSLPGPQTPVGLQVNYVTDLQTRSEIFLHLLKNNALPLIGILVCVVMLRLYGLYRREKARKYFKPLSYNEISLMRAIRDNATRICEEREGQKWEDE